LLAEAQVGKEMVVVAVVPVASSIIPNEALVLLVIM
jgi:hypothetical protein